MCYEWLSLISTDVAGTLLAAAIAILATAWFKSIRLSLQLKQLADILHSIRDQTYKGFSGATDKELCDEAEAGLSAIEEDIERSAEGIFRLSRRFRFEIGALKKELKNVKHRVVVASLVRRVSSDAPSTRDKDSALVLESKIRSFSQRVSFRFWIFLLP